MSTSLGGTTLTDFVVTSLQCSNAIQKDCLRWHVQEPSSSPGPPSPPSAATKPCEPTYSTASPPTWPGLASATRQRRCTRWRPTCGQARPPSSSPPSPG